MFLRPLHVQKKAHTGRLVARQPGVQWSPKIQIVSFISRPDAAAFCAVFLTHYTRFFAAQYLPNSATTITTWGRARWFEIWSKIGYHFSIWYGTVIGSTTGCFLIFWNCYWERSWGDFLLIFDVPSKLQIPSNYQNKKGRTRGGKSSERYTWVSHKFWNSR